MSNSENGLPEKSVNRLKKIKDYGFPLGIIAMSLVIVYILWATFGYIGPSFSNDVLTNQQETLREKYKLPPLEEESGSSNEIPPSLREAMESNTTKTSSVQNNSESSSSVNMTTQSSTTNTTTSNTSGNATTSGSIIQGQQQQSQVTGETSDVTLTILQGSAVQGKPDYEPDELTVKKGNTILVNNVDTMPHTVTNGESGTDPNSAKIFDTSIINGGESANLETANIDAGTYPYYCMVHPYMTGSLTIK